MSSRATAKFVPTTSRKKESHSRKAQGLHFVENLFPQSTDPHFADILMRYNMRASDNLTNFSARTHKGYSLVVVNTKIARSQDLGILASGQCCQDDEDGEIVTILLFKALDKEDCCFDWPYLAKPSAVATVHAQAQHRQAGLHLGERGKTLLLDQYLFPQWKFGWWAQRVPQLI